MLAAADEAVAAAETRRIQASEAREAAKGRVHLAAECLFARNGGVRSVREQRFVDPHGRPIPPFPLSALRALSLSPRHGSHGGQPHCSPCAEVRVAVAKERSRWCVCV